MAVSGIFSAEEQLVFTGRQKIIVTVGQFAHCKALKGNFVNSTVNNNKLTNEGFYIDFHSF